MIKLKNILVEDFQQKKNNFKLELRNKLDQAKDGAVLKVGDLTWTKVNKNWKGGKFNRTEPGQSIVDDIAVMFHNDIKTSANYDASDVFDKIIFEGTRCWKGYEKKGMKTMFGKRVPNCVKREAKLPDEGFSEKDQMIMYDNLTNEDLRAWFGKGAKGSASGGGWDRYNTKGEKIGKCGDRKPGEGKPKCLSKAAAAKMTKKQRAAAVRKKRREDPNPDRRGKAKNVSSKTRKRSKKESVLDEKKKKKKKRDACYHKVKSRYKVWPSAYASGALVQCRKVGAKNWGNKSKK